jgi:hypothetical protein
MGLRGCCFQATAEGGASEHFRRKKSESHDCGEADLDGVVMPDCGICGTLVEEGIIKGTCSLVEW